MLNKDQTEQLFEIADKCDWLLEKLEKAFEEKEKEIAVLTKALTEKQILQEMIGLMYELKDSVFEYDLDNYNKENVEGAMEDFELEDMEDFLKKYPYMKYIPYGVIYDWQKFYNAEYLSAGWCGCCSPERLLKVLRDEKAAKESLK